MNEERKILEYKIPLDYAKMMETLTSMVDRYPFLSFSYLGETIMGRGIPILTLGTGDRALLFVGAQRAREWITSMILLRWLNEACELYAANGKIFRYHIGYLLSTRRIIIVPMLNPDGVEYHLHGVSEGNVLYDRVRSMNQGSDDFSSWQANARGVDLSYNYGVGFSAQKEKEKREGIFGGAPIGFSGESSESEPEVGALCNYLRYHRDIRAVFDLQTTAEMIRYDSHGRTAPRSESMAESLSSFSGYALAKREESEEFATLSDFCIVEKNLPAFTIYCGGGEASLPQNEVFYLYARLRKMLFLSLTLI
ncbi:MAG: hypothetical protein IJD64_04105 [Clostridia bacterium]|nr:hypothetical protein [Clostridia bacterium]